MLPYKFTSQESLDITAQNIDNYVKESVLTPQAKVVAGYTGTNMPSYQGQLTDQHIQALVASVFHQPQVVKMAPHALGWLAVVGQMHRTTTVPADIHGLFPWGQEALGP